MNDPKIKRVKAFEHYLSLLKFFFQYLGLVNGTGGLFGIAATICGFFACFCIGLCTFGGVLLM